MQSRALSPRVCELSFHSAEDGDGKQRCQAHLTWTFEL